MASTLRYGPERAKTKETSDIPDMIYITKQQNTLTPRYPGWPDFRKYIRDNGVSGTTERWGVRIT